MIQDFLKLMDMEEANTSQHASGSSKIQYSNTGYLDLGLDPYLAKASSLYDDAYALIPTKDDTLEELLAKAQRVGDVIEEGASLALSTNKLLTLNGGKTPEQIAFLVMLDNQRQMYKQWKKGDLSLPRIDIDRSRASSTSMGGKSDLERNTRGEVMRRLYKQDNLDEEHYLWFVTAYVYLMPLVNAIKKLIKAERSLTQGDDSITSLDLEESQTINKMVSVFGSRQKEIAKYRVGFVNRAIHRVVSLATERRKAIKNSNQVTNKARELFSGKRRGKHQNQIRKHQILLSRRSSRSKMNGNSKN